MVNYLDEDIMQQLEGRNSLVSVDIPLDKNSLDKKRNNYGYRLISLCKSRNAHITNGWIGVVRDRGSTTCKNVVIVDYILVI